MTLFSFLLCGALGVSITLVLALPAFVVEWRHRRHHDHPILLDIDLWRGHRLSDHASFALGLLLHLLTGLLMGMTFFPFARIVDLPPLAWTTSVFFGALWFVFLNLIVLPVLGAGFFGKREGAFLWLETLATLAVFLVLFQSTLAWFGLSWFL